MPVNKYEPIHDANMIGGWMCDFTKSLKKIKEQQKYDEIWEKIKKKNNW